MKKHEGIPGKVDNPVDETADMAYIRANTDWLAKCRYGISVHWTARSMPRHGAAVDFQEAVRQFNVDAFLEQMLESGADYLIFTVTHALQMIPAPNPVVDRILPGRTCDRDLLMELADRLAQHGKHLILYYNHSCNQKGDAEWEQAVGYHDADKSRFAANLQEIVAWMGRRYGEKARAWWFDSSYSVDPRGPHNSVTTDLHGFQFPWESYSQSAKAGYPQRLVTFNAGVNETFLYTSHQDYWSGELVDLNNPPAVRYMANGLQWHGWTCLDDRDWVHAKADTEAGGPLYSDEELHRFMDICRRHSAPMTFNVIIYQDGTMSPGSIQQLQRTGRHLG